MLMKLELGLKTWGVGVGKKGFTFSKLHSVLGKRTSKKKHHGITQSVFFIPSGTLFFICSAFRLFLCHPVTGNQTTS